MRLFRKAAALFIFCFTLIINFAVVGKSNSNQSQDQTFYLVTIDADDQRLLKVNSHSDRKMIIFSRIKCYD